MMSNMYHNAATVLSKQQIEGISTKQMKRQAKNCILRFHQ